MRQVFLDTETTGLEPELGHRVVEIGCLEMVNRRLTGRQLHCYLNPQRDMPAAAQEVHGLSSEFLSDKPLFADVADEFIQMIEGAELIIHNAPFDVAFLNSELQRVRRSPVVELAAGVVDTLSMAREMYPGKSNSLDALCRRLGVDNTHRERHGALLDAGLLAEVYVRLTRGQESLVMDVAGDIPGQTHEAQAVDWSTLVLPIIEPQPDELQAHQQVMAAIDKASGGKTVWSSPPDGSLR